MSDTELPALFKIVAQLQKEILDIKSDIDSILHQLSVDNERLKTIIALVQQRAQ